MIITTLRMMEKVLRDGAMFAYVWCKDMRTNTSKNGRMPATLMDVYISPDSTALKRVAFLMYGYKGQGVSAF